MGHEFLNVAGCSLVFI